MAEEMTREQFRQARYLIGRCCIPRTHWGYRGAPWMVDAVIDGVLFLWRNRDLSQPFDKWLCTPGVVFKAKQVVMHHIANWYRHQHVYYEGQRGRATAQIDMNLPGTLGDAADDLSDFSDFEQLLIQGCGRAEICRTLAISRYQYELHLRALRSRYRDLRRV